MTTAATSGHAPSRASVPARIRRFVGGFYLTMAGINAGLVFADPHSYQHFADGAYLDFVAEQWNAIVMANPSFWGLLLATGEILLGALLLTGGRAARIGWLGVIAFHLLLMPFGPGIWLWSIPVLAVLVPAARGDWPQLGVAGRQSHIMSDHPTDPGDRTDPAEQRLLPGAVDQYLVARVPVCTPGDTVAQIRDALLGADHEAVDDIAVCDRLRSPRRLIGLIPIKGLLAGDPTVRAGQLMDPDPPVVVEGLDREQAAWKAVQHGESSLAVEDADGHFCGLVPASKLLGVLLREHDEDFARMGGYLSSTRTARLAAEEPVSRRLWHRLPWLVLGLAGAAVSAWLVGLFEGRITADVRLAFFIPGVVYLADAVGTQTEALIVRGLSVGAPVRTALRLEAITGPALGLLLALVSFPTIWVVLGDVQIALTVALALVAACSAATIVAATLPVMMARRGRDPAFGSGPLATVVQDLLSLVVYFAVAVVIMG